MLSLLHSSRSLMACVALLASSHALAQPTSGQVQPDVLDFGHLCVGSTAEGSLRVFVKGETTEGVDVEVDAPPFVQIVGKSLATQEFGTGNWFVVFDVFVSVDTSTAGIYSDDLQIAVGDENVMLPVRAGILEARQDAPRVLIVETPFDRFSTKDGTTFLPWLYVVDELGLNVDYWNVREGTAVLRDADMGRFDVILLAAGGLVRLSDQEVEELQEFVRSGGRLILAANHFFRGTVEAANKVLAPGGLRVSDEEPHRAVRTTTITLSKPDIANHALTAGVGTISVHRPSPVTVTDPTGATLLVEAPEFPGQGYVAIGEYAAGEMVVFGQSLWWNWITQTDCDNRKLLQNLMERQ